MQSKRLFFVISLYPISFFANTLFKQWPFQLIRVRNLAFPKFYNSNPEIWMISIRIRKFQSFVEIEIKLKFLILFFIDLYLINSTVWWSISLPENLSTYQVALGFQSDSMDETDRLDQLGLIDRFDQIDRFERLSSDHDWSWYFSEQEYSQGSVFC